jgi:hypothetical protein
LADTQQVSYPQEQENRWRPVCSRRAHPLSVGGSVLVSAPTSYDSGLIYPIPSALLSGQGQ